MAISHIAGYMGSSQLTLQEALDKFKRQGGYSIWSSERTSLVGAYHRSLDMVWHIALEELTKEALDVLFVMAMFDANEIPEAMLNGQGLDPSSNFQGFDECVDFFLTLSA